MLDKGNKAIIENPTNQDLAELIRPKRIPLATNNSNEINPRFSIAVLTQGNKGASYARTGRKKIGAIIDAKPTAAAAKMSTVRLYFIALEIEIYFLGHFLQHDGIAKPLATQLAAIVLHLSQRDQLGIN
jgi:hypothetical protein